MSSAPNLKEEEVFGPNAETLFEGFRKDEKVFVFIDGSNTHSSANALNFTIDYGRLRKLFNQYMILQRIYFFTALPPDNEMSSLRRRVDWMKHNGFTVVHKLLKEYTDPISNEKIRKGNVDVEMTVHALDLCHHVDHMVLFTGDGDFRSLVEALQNRGKRVTIVSTIRSSPPLAADDLRKQTDFFIDLYDLKPHILRV